MGVRLVAVAIAAVAAIGMLAVMAQVSMQIRRVDVTPRSTAGASSLARFLNQAREAAPPGPDTDWVVNKVNSAHQAIVVEVEAPRPDQARAIASQVVDPLRWRGYYEILIYVRGPRGGTDTTVRRIQWTPNGGFTEMAFDAPR